MTANPPKVKLTADLVEAFAGMFLSPRYDNRVPTAQFHREAWALYTSDHPQCMVIAPREHAKSTALTFAYILAEVLFRASDYVILVSSTEEFAVEQLSNIAEELRTNDELIREFGIESFESDAKADIIVRMKDGHRFRILCRGSEQRIRGRLWKGKRPNLLVFDDCEDDEQVLNKERRDKFRVWFFRAAKQALGRYGRTRIHGTILHEDGHLARLRTNPSWKHLYYKAHAAFDDFSNPLWPENWPEARLRGRRQEFIDAGDSAGYSQEFLNDPQDNADAFLRRQDFIPMSDDDLVAWKSIACAWDFAVSKLDLANRTSCTVGGKCIQNLLHFLDFRVGRWSPSETKGSGEIGWIDVMFEVEQRWHPEAHFVEDGVIWKAVEKVVYEEMRSRDIWMNIVAVPSIKDKATRGTSLRKRHRAGMTRWNTKADGYEGAKDEMLRFTGFASARLDDQFDSAALLSLGFDSVGLMEDEDAVPEEEWSMRRADPRRQVGRSAVTGY